MVFHTHKVSLAAMSLCYFILFSSHFILVYQVIEYGQHRSTSKTFQALFAHFLVFMAVVSHVRAMTSDPGYVPLPETKIDFSSDLEKGVDGQKKKIKLPPIDEWTICTHCETYRPPRSHHCRKCNRCVRRMDHHCPWTNNCIGVLNLKYFILFIFYLTLFCLYCIILIGIDWRSSSNQGYSSFWDKLLTILLFFISVTFGMFVSAMGAGQAISILCDRNALEIRRYGAPTKFPSIPRTVLLQAICGRGPKLLWLLPCVTPRIPDPVPPAKYSMFANNSVHNV